MLAFRHTKQTSKDVAGTTFKQQAKQDEAQTWSKLNSVKARLKKCDFFKSVYRFFLVNTEYMIKHHLETLELSAR